MSLQRLQVLNNRYAILNIFLGGMGTVYSCYDLQMEEYKALKTIKLDMALSLREKEDLKNKFKQEALTWTQIPSHPFIVKAISWEEIDSEMYLVLEFIPKDKCNKNQLSDYLKSPEGISEASKVKWIFQFCEAMSHAIQNGLHSHLDIKPNNILIHPNGDLKITDFGLSKLSHSKLIEEFGPSILSKFNLAENYLWANWHYAAPERFEGKGDIRSDIYSFGVILFQLETNGTLPFEKPTSFFEALSIKKMPRKFSFSSPLASIINNCLAVNPDDRYQNFDSLKVDLESALLLSSTTKAKPKDRQHPWDWYNKAIVLGNLGFPKKAIELYEKTLKEGDFNRIDFSQVYTNLGTELKKLGHFEAAKKAFEDALSIRKNLHEAHYNLGVLYNELGETEKSIASYLNALESFPNDHSTWNNIGSIFQSVGLAKEAIEAYHKALEFNPFYDKTHANLGNLYFGLDDWENADFHYKKAIQLNPDNPISHKTYSAALLGFYFLEESMKQVEIALKIDPFYEKAVLLKNDIITKTNMLNSNELKQIIAEQLNSEGVLFAQQNQYIRAKANWIRALNLCPDHGQVIGNLGQILLMEGKFSKAMYLFEKAANLNPDSKEALINLGQAFIKNEDYKSAIEPLKKANEIDPKYFQAIFNLAFAQFKLGQYSESEVNFNKFLKLVKGPSNNLQIFEAKRILQEIQSRK